MRHYGLRVQLVEAMVAGVIPHQFITGSALVPGRPPTAKDRVAFSLRTSPNISQHTRGGAMQHLSPGSRRHQSILKVLWLFKTRAGDLTACCVGSPCSTACANFPVSFNLARPCSRGRSELTAPIASGRRRLRRGCPEEGI